MRPPRAASFFVGRRWTTASPIKRLPASAGAECGYASVEAPSSMATLEDDDARRLTSRHRVVLSLDKPAVVSHTSASVLLNLPTWGYDLSHIHVTRADLHSARIEGGVHHHAGSLETGDVISVDGVEVTSLDRTAIQIALMGGFERGVVVADAALRLLGGDQAVRSTDSIGCATGKAHERRAVSSSSLTGGPSRWASHAPGSYSSWRAFRDHNSKN
jgi:hypothetical protein